MTPITMNRMPHRTGSPALHLDALTPVRGVPLLEPGTLTLQPGTLLGIGGPNGAGKSSLLGAMAATGVPRRGVTRYGDAVIAKMRANGASV